MHEAETRDQVEQLLKTDFSFAGSFLIASGGFSSAQNRRRENHSESRRVFLSWECSEQERIPQSRTLIKEVASYLDSMERKLNPPAVTNSSAPNGSEAQQLKKDIIDTLGTHCVVCVIKGARISIVATMNSESVTDSEEAKRSIKANVALLGEMSLTDERLESMSRTCRRAAVSISSFVAAGGVYSMATPSSVSPGTELLRVISGLNSLDSIRDFQRSLNEGAIRVVPGPMSVVALPLAAVIPLEAYPKIRQLLRQEDMSAQNATPDPRAHTFLAQDIFETLGVQHPGLDDPDIVTTGIQLFNNDHLQGNSQTNNAQIVLSIKLQKDGVYSMHATYENQWGRSLKLWVNQKPDQNGKSTAGKGTEWPSTGPEFRYRQVCTGINLRAGDNYLVFRTAGWPAQEGATMSMLHLRAIRLERLNE